MGGKNSKLRFWRKKSWRHGGDANERYNESSNQGGPDPVESSIGSRGLPVKVDARLICGTKFPGGGDGEVGDVALFADDGQGYVFDSAKRRLSGPTWKAHNRSVSSASCNGRDDGILVTGSRDLSIRCWNRKCEQVARMDEAHELTVTATATSRVDNEYFASGARDTFVKIWNVANGALSLLDSKELARNLPTCMKFDDQSVLYQGSEDLAVRCWDWKRSGMAKPTTVLNNYTYFPTCMDLQMDSGQPYLLTGCKGFDGTGCGIYLWDLRNPSSPVHHLSGHQQEVVGCSFVMGSKDKAVSVSKDKVLYTWDLQQGKSLEQTYLNFELPCTCLVPNTKETSVVVASFDGEVLATNVDISNIIVS